MGEKRIAFIDLLFHWPPTGGSWVDLKEIATRLNHRGFKVKLFVPLFTTFFPRGLISKSLEIEIETIPFDIKSFTPEQVTHEFMKALRKYKPDYVFLGDGYSMKVHIANAAVKEYPVILRFYSHEIFCPRINMIKLPDKVNCNNHMLISKWQCLRCLFRPIETIMATSKFIRKKWGNNTGCLHLYQEFLSSRAYSKEFTDILIDTLKCCHTVIVYNSFINNMISPYCTKTNIITSGVAKDRFLMAENFNQKTKIILMAGRVDDPAKGLSTLREAVKKLEQKRDDFEVIVTSTNIWQDGKIRSVGWLSQEELPDLYKKAYCAVVPVLWREPFGITTIEAMASGLPVIVSSLGGPREIVDDGITGFHVPPDNSKSLENAINQLLNEPDMAQQMGLKGREKVEKMYDWENIIDQNYLNMLS